jgi:UDP-N-acetylmuramate dehydrogenase
VAAANNVALADLTTLAVGGPAQRYVQADDASALIAAVREADAEGLDVLVLAGGSNVVVADAGFPGTVVHVKSRGIEVVDDASCGGVMVTVSAGEPWDAFVARAVDEGWVGVEALSGIPGSAGATPIQNVGAYGQEVAQTIAQVRTFDREAGEVRTFAAGDCDFGYRTSLFRRNPRYVVLDVTFQFVVGTVSAPVAYEELAVALQIGVGDRAPLTEVRDAVLALRAGKGMVIDPDDADTRSAGSFFTNPILLAEQAERLPLDAPRWPLADGSVKTSAAWLIQNAGFSKGFAQGSAALSSKHALAVTNRGGASADDVLGLAATIRAGVYERFGIVLEPEPVLIGASLPALPDHGERPVS